MVSQMYEWMNGLVSFYGKSDDGYGCISVSLR